MLRPGVPQEQGTDSSLKMTMLRRWSPQEQGTDSSHKMTMLRPGVPQEQGTDSSHKMTMLRPGEEPDPKSRVKVEVAVLGSPSLISLMVSVDVVQHTKEQAGEAQDKRADS